MIDKGQIKSEWIYESINFPKNEPEKFEGFLPYVCTIKTLRARADILQTLRVIFWKIDDFINSF